MNNNLACFTRICVHLDHVNNYSASHFARDVCAIRVYVFIIKYHSIIIILYGRFTGEQRYNMITIDMVRPVVQRYGDGRK